MKGNNSVFNFLSGLLLLKQNLQNSQKDHLALISLRVFSPRTIAKSLSLSISKNVNFPLMCNELNFHEVYLFLYFGLV